MAAERVVPLRPVAGDDTPEPTPMPDPAPHQTLVLPGGSRWPWFDPRAEARVEAREHPPAADDAA